MSWNPLNWGPSNWDPPNWQPGSGSSSDTDVVARVSFRPRIAPKLYRASLGDKGDLTFEDVYKDAADTLPVRLVFSGVEGIARFWQPDEAVDGDEHARPTTPTGFAYRCQVPGRTGPVEPPWPTTLEATVVDGSVTWVCVASELNGFNLIESPVCVMGPGSDAAANNVAVEEGVNIIADYTGGANGDDYEAVFSFGVAGMARRARQKVYIRKR